MHHRCGVAPTQPSPAGGGGLGLALAPSRAGEGSVFALPRRGARSRARSFVGGAGWSSRFPAGGEGSVSRSLLRGRGRARFSRFPAGGLGFALAPFAGGAGWSSRLLLAGGEGRSLRGRHRLPGCQTFLFAGSAEPRPGYATCASTRAVCGGPDSVRQGCPASACSPNAIDAWTGQRLRSFPPAIRRLILLKEVRVP
jgi:hypothetical protein